MELCRLWTSEASCAGLNTHTTDARVARGLAPQRCLDMQPAGDELNMQHTLDTHARQRLQWHCARAEDLPLQLTAAPRNSRTHVGADLNRRRRACQIGGHGDMSMAAVMVVVVVTRSTDSMTQRVKTPCLGGALG